MRRLMLKSKIHRVRVTSARLDYVGSISVDADLLRQADILPFEQVHVLNLATGARLVTYAIEDEAGSGVIQANGAAAWLLDPGHLIIIVAYAEYDETELRNFRPKIVLPAGGP